MKRAQKSGTTVIATKYDANRASTTASASAENRKRLTPYRNVTGKKTTELVSVAASTAIDTSSPPLSAATAGASPSLQVPEDVLQHDDGVVDQPREHQRKAREHHRVDRLAADVQQQ